MLHKPLFILAHQAQYSRFYSTYKNVVNNQWKSYEDQKVQQEKQLRQMIKFAYGNVPYYHRLFKELKISPDNIQNIEDLEKLPILTKDVIKSNWNEFIPSNLFSLRYYNRTTGGSTGNPLEYRLSKADRFLSASLLYRGWGYSGYELGNKMVFLAGTSLDVGSNTVFVKKIHEITRNIKKLSAFDMNEIEINNYTDTINHFKPNAIRGYASSIDYFAKYILNSNTSIQSPDAVFTTAEKLYPRMRERISNAFDCDVYDCYGLNDGGVTAFECEEHSGLHIDTERSVMEIASTDGKQINCGEGKILATTLGNYAMPLIRYDTGDLGYILEDSCSCGRGSKLLKEIIGRDKELLVTPTGKLVHGAAFYNNMINEFNNANDVIECQIVQKEKDRLIFNIVCSDNFDEAQLDDIQETVMKKNGWNVEFRFVDEIKKTQAGKHKFIINEVAK